AHEGLIGTTADLSHNPGKFQLPVAQNRGARHNGPELTSKWISSTGQGQPLPHMVDGKRVGK
ncbi:hypothetical protein, partial [Rhizobium sp. RU35A]|uniref:hypothetical protein n=1 Tax=Rhizobium sp. RU35A TaxID=1907414 RepID=UPI001AED484D